MIDLENTRPNSMRAKLAQMLENLVNQEGPGDYSVLTHTKGSVQVLH